MSGKMLVVGGIDKNVPMFRRVKECDVKTEDTCDGCPADSEKRRVNQSTTIHNHLNSLEIVDKSTRRLNTNRVRE